MATPSNDHEVNELPDIEPPPEQLSEDPAQRMIMLIRESFESGKHEGIAQGKEEGIFIGVTAGFVTIAGLYLAYTLYASFIGPKPVVARPT